jgi:isochorismate synthase
MTFIALPAPLVSIETIAAAWPRTSLVAWATGEIGVVGVGSARELRGYGASRFADIVSAANRIRIGAVVGNPSWTPRLLGGFAFAPGAAAQEPWSEFGDAWFALPRWTYSNAGWLVLAVDANDARDHARWHSELATFRGCFARPFRPQPPPAVVDVDAGNPDDWRRCVRDIVSAISQGKCAKIVAARRARVTLASDIRSEDLLAELTAQQSDCTRLLVRPNHGASLVAATPERLVRLTGTRVECDALAGSHPRSSDVLQRPRDEATLLASGKDRQEHALVVDAIVAALRELGGTVESRSEPTIRALRHVLHLHTPISARLAAKRHVLELVAKLHPTPAMGGTPTRAATAWIAEHESARGWYASPVGWFDLEGNGEFAVAIRCGLVPHRPCQASDNPGRAGVRATPAEGVRRWIDIWAGAGIVAGSDPDRELAETEVKLRAILGALGVA